MCLAVPGKVLEIDGTLAKVDFGHGTVRDVDISLVDVAVGQYILVHTGYAIQIMDEDEARASLDLWNEILKRLEGE
jgi:hydrogenase expression/formation protein HypC